MAGLDALILLIAIILASVVLTYAYLGTTKNLMAKDQDIAIRKQNALQKPVVIDQIRAVDEDSDRLVDNLIIRVRQRWGDDPLFFNGTIIVVDSKVINCTALSYGPDSNEDCAYTIRYVSKGGDFRQNYMNSGDIVEIVFFGPNLIGGASDYNSIIRIVPHEAMPTVATFEFPQRIYPANMQLWPLRA